jgi:cysteinyl-tRNA synthetase
MTLKLYNTRTRQKEIFEPLDSKSVRMYVCGPTVYDFAHIGNARPLIVFDVLFRLLKHLAQKGEWDRGKGETKVIYVRNITDVDDKINARATQEGISIRQLTERTAAQFHADAEALRCLPPTVEPRATEHIAEMISLTQQLIERGHAYAAEGHVLFDVASDPDYGSLANRSVEEMRAGARIEVAPYKRDPMDFVLWKPSSGDEPGWESPWGFGRPGWHLECSAMSEKYLGRVFDIHGGGIDLVFPHHENEVAQSTCAHGTKIMANIWMHNGHLQVEGQKMSKSLGNFITINDLRQKLPGEFIRFAMLMTHYRDPMNWTENRLNEAWQEWSGWVETLQDILSENLRAKLEVNTAVPIPDDLVREALLDDLNTPKVITRLRQLSREASSGDPIAADSFGLSLMWLGLYRFQFRNAYDYSGVSGTNVPPAFLSKYYETALRARAIVLNEYDYRTTDFRHRMQSRAEVEAKINRINPHMKQDGVKLLLGEHCDIELVPASEGTQFEDKVATLISNRLAARKAKDWKEADRIRGELAAMGIALKDAKNPATGEIETTWEIAR